MGFRIVIVLSGGVDGAGIGWMLMLMIMDDGDAKIKQDEYLSS